MIVNYTKTDWAIIAQRCHGLLAAEICARWSLSNQPKRWVETLIACAGHDDIYIEFEPGALLSDKGGPLNFNMGDGSFTEKPSQRLIDMAITRSSFIALLTARHIAFTHSADPLAKKFLAKLKKQEKNWMKAANTTEDEVHQAYELLEFCDAFSLLICQNMLQPEQRSLEISCGPDGTKYYVITEGENLQVNPWPFELEEFDVSYETRNLPQLVFESETEFKKVLYKTVPERITLKLKKKL